MAFNTKGDYDACLNKYRLHGTTNIIYKISEYPEFLFIIFDMTYNDTNRNINSSKKILTENLKNSNNSIDYELISFIYLPYKRHFSCYINKNSEVSNKNKKNKDNHYNNDTKNNGYIIKIENIEKI